MIFPKNISLSSPNIQLYLIKSIIKTLLEIDDNRKALISLLQNNLQILDEKFVYCLKEWIDTSDLEEENILALIDLSNFLQDFSEINFAIKTEIEIAGYEQGLEIIDRLDEAEDWALIQYNLGNAYRKRVEGGERKKWGRFQSRYIFHERSLSIINPTRRTADIRILLANSKTVLKSDR